jgi:hypothetical protein
MRQFTGIIPDHKALNPESETYATDKWNRGHEQRRLRAYLKGGEQFAHGREPAFPVGFRPIMWNVAVEQK